MLSNSMLTSAKLGEAKSYAREVMEWEGNKTVEPLDLD